jgi:hypothetical protein
MLETAKANNPTIQLALHDIEASKYKYDLTKGHFLPKITLQAGQTWGAENSSFILSTQNKLNSSLRTQHIGKIVDAFVPLICSVPHVWSLSRLREYHNEGGKFGDACFNHSLFLWQLGVPSASLVITESDRDRAIESERVRERE